MNISKSRQYINDSTLGQKINNTTLGLIFEDTCQNAYDFLQSKFYSSLMSIGHQTSKVAPIIGKSIGIITVLSASAAKINEQSPENHYSLKSKLFRIVKAKKRNKIVRRTLAEALQDI
jgi:hypothetical protein